jgi:molybdopterin converting factor small subunit
MSPSVINILYFGSIRDLTGKGSEQFENPGSLISLKNQLTSKFPGLEGMHFQFSINRRLIKGDEVVSDGDEVALLPPFAGG